MEYSFMEMRLVGIFIVMFLASCAAVYRGPETGADRSVLNISSLTGEIPFAKMMIVDETFVLDSHSIGIVNTEHVPNDILVPVGKIIRLNFTYQWPGEKVTYLQTHNMGYSEHVERVVARDIERCDNSISFVPLKDKFYRVYFKFLAGQCSSWVVTSK